MNATLRPCEGSLRLMSLLMRTPQARPGTECWRKGPKEPTLRSLPCKAKTMGRESGLKRAEVWKLSPTLQRTPTTKSHPFPEKAQLKYPRLGSRLNNLVVRVEEGETSAQEAADSAPMRREGSVAVTVHLSGNVADMVGFLEDNGGVRATWARTISRPTCR